MKHIGINITKGVQDLYEENYKTDESQGSKKRDSLCSWIKRLTLVKMSVLSNLTCRYNGIPIKILESCFVEKNWFQSLYAEAKSPRIAKQE